MILSTPPFGFGQVCEYVTLLALRFGNFSLWSVSNLSEYNLCQRHAYERASRRGEAPPNMRAFGREYIQKGRYLDLKVKIAEHRSDRVTCTRPRSENHRARVLIEWYIQPRSEICQTGVVVEWHIRKLSSEWPSFGNSPKIKGGHLKSKKRLFAKEIHKQNKCSGSVTAGRQDIKCRESLRHFWHPLMGGCLINFVDADFYFKMTDVHFSVLFITYFTTRKCFNLDAKT